jgi:AAA+ ATPase superfamily predicted ATPase
MILKMVDREEELKLLEKTKYHVLIYGRRRIGKTRLIKEYIQGKKAFYFLCQKNNLEAEFDRFLHKYNQTFNVYIQANNFEEFFEQVENTIFVFDEFSYWVEKNPNVTSLFQYIIDEVNKNNRFIFCGSIIGTMESILSYKNPLYGRIKIRMKLKQLKFKYLKEFLPNYSVKDLIKVYACVGGVPEYLNFFDVNMSFTENIYRTLFNKFCFLYDDAERILKDELKDPDRYLRLLEVIGSGETKLGKIASKSYIDITNLPKYLRILEKMDIIKYEKCIFGKNKLVEISDNYFNFWCLFVYPYREEIELGVYEFPKIKFHLYLSKVFEDLCRKIISDEFKLVCGRWWHKDKEIDIIAYDDSKLVFGECKWKDNVNPEKICKELIEKIQYVEVPNNLKNHKKELWIFAKSFKNKIDQFEDYKVRCFDLNDLEKLINKS